MADKISYKQAVMLFLLSYLSPAIRFIAVAAAKSAKRAGWLTPLYAIPIILILIYILNVILKKYDKHSYVDIIKDIFGKYIGTVVCVVIFIWLIIVATYNLRYHVTRIVTSVSPGFDMVLLTFIILSIVIYVISKGLVPLARMGEIFFAIVVIIFGLSCVLMLSKVKIDNLLPITFSPFKASLSVGMNIASFWHLYIPILIVMDKIEKKENFKKTTLFTMLFFVISSLIIITIPYGVFGSSLLAKMPAPFMNSAKEISFLGIFERVDSLIVVFWVFTDFVQTSLTIYGAAYLIKKLFNIEKINPIIYVYTTAIFYLCISFVSSSFELAKVGENFLFLQGFVIAFGIPLMLYIVGKARKKI